MHFIIGLGNPGTEYENTRHNAGRMAALSLVSAHGDDFSLWKEGKKPNMRYVMGVLDGSKVTVVLPDTYMNNSGHAAAHFVKNKKNAGNLIVLHDDLDMPIGSLKISFGRSSGGHRGVESVIQALKTRDFVRVRIGVARRTPKGLAKKPIGEDAVLKFLLGKFSAPELMEVKKVSKRAREAIESIARDGRERAMNIFNA